jgi:hypothetical protein
VADGSQSDPQFDYSVNAFGGAWSYSAKAGSTRELRVSYQSTGFYGWYQVVTKLEAFVSRAGKDVYVKQLAAQGPVNCCTAPSGGFDYSGSTAFDVQTGDVYGFRMSGTHYTADPVMRGSIFVREYDESAPTITPVIEGRPGANGFYTGPVKVSWTITDPDSRIIDTQGCDPVTVSDESVGKQLTCSASTRGGKAIKSVNIAVDGTGPDLSVPAAVAVQAPTAGGAVVSYDATATDKVDVAPALECTPASGSVLPVGTTKVSCTATDAAGNQTTKAFDALVVAPTPPPAVIVTPKPAPKTINAILSFRFTITKQTTKLVSLKVKNVPKGATVLVRCSGGNCPKALRGKGRTLTSRTSSVSLATLVKSGLRKGTTINVTISSPGAITAIKTLTVRQGKAPVVK